MGIMMKPTDARATAPEDKLARKVSWGRDEDVRAVMGVALLLLLTPRSRFARDVRKAFSVVK